MIVIGLIMLDIFVLNVSLCFITSAIFAAEEINYASLRLAADENPEYAHSHFISDHQNFIAEY